LCANCREFCFVFLQFRIPSCFGQICRGFFFDYFSPTESSLVWGDLKHNIRENSTNVTRSSPTSTSRSILSTVSLPPPHSSSSSSIIRAQHLIPTRRKAEEDDTTIQKYPCCIDVASFHPAATSDQHEAAKAMHRHPTGQVCQGLSAAASSLATRRFFCVPTPLCK
jgi:hypothetical protein